MLDIRWSKSYSVKQGVTAKWRREWCIPDNMVSPFFIFWKANRFRMLADGFTVKKSEHSGKWYLYETKDNVALFHEFSTTQKKSTPDVPAIILPDYKLKNTEGLRPWQIEPAEKIISALNYWGAAIDGSELGVGKTYQNLGVIREMDVPFVVVCPKPVIYQWNKVISDHFKLKNCRGIINYELLIRGRKDSDIASFVLSRETGRKNFIWKLPKNSIILWDEAHRLKNWKTKASKVCIEAYKQGYKQIFLSATMASSPLDLRTIGVCTKMFRTAKEYYNWAYDHGIFKGDWGLEFNNSPAALKRIHRYLFDERGVRLLRDVIPNFPETEIIVNAYDIDEEDAAKIREIYDEMKRELALIKSKEKNDESEMAIRVHALQKTEMLKIPLIEDMVREGRESGMSVIVFLNFSDSIDALAKRINTKCIYDGRNDPVRQKYIEAFQSNEEPILIANLSAAREGLNCGDEHGGHPRLALISPNDSVQKLKQVFGRVHRENSKTKSIQKLVYIANTQEEDVVDNVGQKLENLTLINNGIITDNDLKI